jgi:hypothetical protein
MSKHHRFTREFKLEALRFLEAGEKTPADLARELGVPQSDPCCFPILSDGIHEIRTLFPRKPDQRLADFE